MKIPVLTSSLLVRKGDAMPSSFIPPSTTRPAVRLPATSESPSARANGIPHLHVVGNASRVRISIRLDPDRHRALKLIAAHTGRSIQDLAVAALDEYLGALSADVHGGECLCLNGKAAPGAGSEES